MSGSPTPTSPGGNVVPMQNWSQPWLRPPASSPGCFSALAGLNQCYDDIIMMQQILQKVICDMAANNKDFQQCIANAVAAVGAGLPITGVTNGVAAQPGIVGEFIQFQATGTIATGSTNFVVTPGILQPGDWQCYGVFGVGSAVEAVTGQLSPLPTGFSTAMVFYMAAANPPAGTIVNAPMEAAQALISVPTLVNFNVQVTTTTASTYDLLFQALRVR